MAALTPTTLIYQAFEERKEKPRFLASLFNFDGKIQTQEDFEWDVRRGSRPVAVPVQSLASGPRPNQLNAFTTKHGQAPVFLESVNATVYEANQRAFGSTINADVDVVASIMTTLETGIDIVTGKIVRALELQASQILQTGAVSTIDSTGATVFSQDYGMKASHRITAAVAWSNTTTGTPVTDLEAACRVVKADCGKRVTKAVFGTAAWVNFRAHPQVQALVNTQLWNRFAVPSANQSYLSDAGNFLGTLTIDGTAVEMWTYDATYLPANSGTEARFIGTDNVILVADSADRKIAIGNIPRLAPMQAPFAGRVPQALKSTGPGGYAIELFAYMTPNALVATVELGCRAVAVPLELDSFACIDTTP